MNILLGIVLGIFTTELVGYVIHRLLHTEYLPWLKKSHMTHHLELYPIERLRSKVYEAPVHARYLGIGIEWLIPITVVLIPLMALFITYELSGYFIISFLVASIAWALVFLNWMHDLFHLKNPRLRKYKWFKKIRICHDLHHIDMSRNFGISFFWLDKIFKTYFK